MIITHQSLDWDALGAVWLLKRYAGMEDHEVVFVNTGAPDPALLARADAVVDTGREFDPARLRFDHHQLPGKQATDTSAAYQVAMWLYYEKSVDVAHLQPLFDLILCGDTGRKEKGADWSRIVGLHALLSAQKARKLDDAALLAYGFDLCRAVRRGLRHKDSEWGRVS